MVIKPNIWKSKAGWRKFHKFWTSAILEWLKLRNNNYGGEVTSYRVTSQQNFIKIYQLVKNY
jgi:hypothetical protein